MRTWFTSDTHFGHANMFRKFNPQTRRVFGSDQAYQSVQEMDADMIRVWNERVAPEDDVWMLGDVSFYHSYEPIANVLRQLNGRKRLVLGNHDPVIIEHRDRFISEGLFYSIDNYAEMNMIVDGKKQKVVMFHFPMAVWHKNHHGAFHLYGHCHGSFTAVGKQMDVGWDTNDLPGHIPGPISWEQVKECLSARPQVVQDHHDAGRTDHEGKM